MNGSDFDCVVRSAPAPLFRSYDTSQVQSSDIFKVEEEFEANPALMECVGGLFDSSGYHANTIESGSQTRMNIREPYHTSRVDVPDRTSKRKHNLEEDSLSDSDQPSPPKSKGAKSSNNLKLACPFFKKEPSKFTRRQACSGPGFSSISRLKEHLYRVHKQPDNQCIRCYSTFTSKGLLQGHLRADVSCEKSANGVSDGITEEQCIRLRKKPSGHKSQAEQWETIYGILFPDASSTPSCYYELQDTTSPTLETYSLRLKQAETALIAGVQKDLKYQLGEVSHEIRSKIFDIIQGRVERTIQELLDKTEETEQPTLSTPAKSPEYRPFEQTFDFDASSLNFDFQGLGPDIVNSQFFADDDLTHHDLTNIFPNSPENCLNLPV